MYFLYVDESGDVGTGGSPTRYFCLSGLVVHETAWADALDDTITLRRALRAKYGLKLREEIHAAHFIHKPQALARIPKSMRLRLLRDVLDFEATQSVFSVLNIVVDKWSNRGRDIFEIAWSTLIQRFENTLSYKNFPASPNAEDQGMLIVDQTDEVKLRTILRRMRRFNPVPSKYGMQSRSVPLASIVEDPVHRNSLHSYFIQLADVNAYFLFQMHQPCGYVQRKGAKNYVRRLAPVLCTVASSSNPLGIVYR